MMYENQNKHYAINVFSERNVRNVIFLFLFTRFFSSFSTGNIACDHYAREKGEEIRNGFP